jgi:hypothetical protein
MHPVGGAAEQRGPKKQNKKKDGFSLIQRIWRRIQDGVPVTR